MSKNISRRALLTGAGAVGGAAALGAMTPASAASAASAAPRSARAARAQSVRPATEPLLPASLASNPEHGISYRFVGWHDFAAEVNTTRGRAFGGIGAYTDVSADYLAAFTDIPQGATIHDVEFYLSNSATVELYGITWVAGTGPYSGPYWLETAHDANTSVHAIRFPVATKNNGPFPFGSRIGVSLSTPTDASVQINGVRFGLKNAPAGTVLLPKPSRAYDSTKHGSLKGGQKRAVSLAGSIPGFASGAILSLSASNTHGHGQLHVGAQGVSSSPAVLQWSRTGDHVTTVVTSSVSGLGQLSVACPHGSGQTDFTIDVTGYLA